MRNHTTALPTLDGYDSSHGARSGACRSTKKAEGDLDTPFRGSHMSLLARTRFAAQPALFDVYVPRESIQLTVNDVIYADIHWDITERFRVNLTQVIRHFQTASYSLVLPEEFGN